MNPDDAKWATDKMREVVANRERHYGWRDSLLLHRTRTRLPLVLAKPRLEWYGDPGDAGALRMYRYRVYVTNTSQLSAGWHDCKYVSHPRPYRLALLMKTNQVPHNAHLIVGSAWPGAAGLRPACCPDVEGAKIIDYPTNSPASQPITCQISMLGEESGPNDEELLCSACYLSLLHPGWVYSKSNPADVSAYPDSELLRKHLLERESREARECLY